MSHLGLVSFQSKERRNFHLSQPQVCGISKDEILRLFKKWQVGTTEQVRQKGSGTF